MNGARKADRGAILALLLDGLQQALRAAPEHPSCSAVTSQSTPRSPNVG